MKTTLRLTLLACLLAAPRPCVSEPVVVKIDASQKSVEINPFIYGQFIEHLGRCIYGGIWAEMLQDRKFYFPITTDYAPYKSLQDTRFPVVGASPWRIVGEPSGVAMDSSEPFVGEHTPRLRAGTGIEQTDLAVQQGRDYVGRIWLKGDAEVRVTIEAGAVAQTILTVRPTDEYATHDFRFTGPAESETATLRVEAVGDGRAYVGTVSLMPADNDGGMRRDTIALLKRLNAPVYRWPGGNFVSGYDWRDGIGPRDRRPPRKNPAWTGVEHNDFGIDEFVRFCRVVGAEPMIAANTGFGDDYSAAQEVEYCNASSDTIGGRWRAENGSPEPFGVKYWCVGNEMFGSWQLGYMRLDHYSLKHNLFAKAMWRVDPDLVLVAVGDIGAQNSSGETGWSKGMLRGSADYMDLISEHFYAGRVPWNRQGRRDTVAQHVAEMRDSIRAKAEGHRALQDSLGLTGESRIPIAMDEWNYWHRDYEYGELGCRYDLADALGVAVGLHEFFRSSDIVQMAHYAQTVNVIGCIKTTKTDAFLATTALPLIVYREHFGSEPVPAECAAPESLLDVAAALTPDGDAITIGVVNPTPQPRPLRFTIDGMRVSERGEAWLVQGNDPTATNDEDNRRLQIERVSVEQLSQWTAPAYSFAVLRFETQ